MYKQKLCFGHIVYMISLTALLCFSQMKKNLFFLILNEIWNVSTLSSFSSIFTISHLFIWIFFSSDDDFFTQKYFHFA